MSISRVSQEYRPSSQQQRYQARGGGVGARPHPRNAARGKGGDQLQLEGHPKLGRGLAALRAPEQVLLRRRSSPGSSPSSSANNFEYLVVDLRHRLSISRLTLSGLPGGAHCGRRRDRPPKHFWRCDSSDSGNPIRRWTIRIAAQGIIEQPIPRTLPPGRHRRVPRGAARAPACSSGGPGRPGLGL